MGVYRGEVCTHTSLDWYPQGFVICNNCYDILKDSEILTEKAILGLRSDFEKLSIKEQERITELGNELKRSSFRTT